MQHSLNRSFQGTITIYRGDLYHLQGSLAKRNKRQTTQTMLLALKTNDVQINKNHELIILQERIKNRGFKEVQVNRIYTMSKNKANQNTG